MSSMEVCELSEEVKAVIFAQLAGNDRLSYRDITKESSEVHLCSKKMRRLWYWLFYRK